MKLKLLLERKIKAEICHSWDHIQDTTVKCKSFNYFSKLLSCIPSPYFPGLFYLERYFTQGDKNFLWFSIKDPVLYSLHILWQLAEYLRKCMTWVLRDWNILLKNYSSLAKINSVCYPKIFFLASLTGSGKTKWDVSLLMQSIWQCMKHPQVKKIKNY